MADTAAHLVDRVLPHVPVRQWVLSLPFALRYRMAYDSRLTAAVLNVFIRALFGEYRRRGRQLLGLVSSQCGAVTFVQRFGDALNANVHFHCIALDGIYAAAAVHERDRAQTEFHALPAPEDDEVLRLASLVSRRVAALLERRGIGEQADAPEADPLSEAEPGMAALLANSVRRRIAIGPNQGHGMIRFGDEIDVDTRAFESPRCAMVSGFSVHANLSIDGRDRDRIERLCRYAARPAVSTERLTELPDGRLLYRLKRPWRDGTSAVVFERQDFMSKLAVLVPAPHAHLTRFHGILAPAAAWRSLVVPKPEQNIQNAITTAGACSATSAPDEPDAQSPSTSQGRNYTWSQLMKRVF